MENVPQHQYNYVITDFDSLLLFVNHSTILLSALLHYSDQLKPLLQSHNIETKQVIQEVCVYLLTITKELVTHTKGIKQDFWEFFIF